MFSYKPLLSRLCTAFVCSSLLNILSVSARTQLPSTYATMLQNTSTPVTGLGLDGRMVERQNVELIGQYGGYGFAVAVQGSYAYLGTSLRLVILDISNPADPVAVGHTNILPGIVRDVEVEGSYAYVAAGGAGLIIIDISNPSAPKETSFYDMPGTASGIAVVGAYVYVLDDDGLRIIDASSPAMPREIGFCDTLKATRKAVVSGGYAYVTDSCGLSIIDVGTPANPTQVGFYWMPDIGSVAVAGTYAYVSQAVYQKAIHILDISDPTIPRAANIYRVSFTVGDIVMREDHAYVADDDGGLRIFNVTNPASPIEIGFYNLPAYPGVSVTDMAVSGNYVYLTEIPSSDPSPAPVSGGLHMINVVNPATPTETSFYKSPTAFTHRVAIMGHYAYVTDISRGLVIIDVSKPASPTEAGAYLVPQGGGAWQWLGIMPTIVLVAAIYTSLM